MKKLFLALSLVLSTQAFAGNVLFQSELERFSTGKNYSFIQQDVRYDAQVADHIITFRKCVANRSTLIGCTKIGSKYGYYFSELGRRDKNLKVKAILEKTAVTSAMIVGGGFVLFYSAGAAVAATGAAGTAYATAGYIGLGASAAGMVSAAGFSTTNLIDRGTNVVFDWTPSGVLVAGKTIKSDLDFYKNNVYVKGSLDQVNRYVGALSQALKYAQPTE